jgi:hypothetical protein
MLIIDNSLEHLLGMSQRSIFGHVENLRWAQKGSADVNRNQILASFGFFVFEEADRLGLPVQVRIFGQKMLPTINQGDVSQPATSDVDERIVEQRLINNEAPEDVLLDRGLIEDGVET